MAIETATKLAIYNGALRWLGERKLSSITEDRHPRHVLDDIWGSGNAIVVETLENANWNFAIRTSQIDYNPAIEPDFGFSRAFTRPTDFLRKVAISGSEYFSPPLTHAQLQSEGEYWFSDFDSIFVRYISDDSDYGLDSAKWPVAFKKYLEVRMAWEACETLTNDDRKMAKLDRLKTDFWRRAVGNDGLEDGVKFAPAGSWVTARGGRARYRGET
ncbi:MAG: hypothetical protein R3186_05005 [Ruegeria sp.]|nr:hypothetical protein [Ruegeria sp.]